MFAAAVMMLATAVAVGIAKKLNLASIVALLVVGMALGPHSPLPLLTGHIDQLQAVGEIGVMLLLFVVGLDVQPKSLWSMRRLVFGLGPAQYHARIVLGSESDGAPCPSLHELATSSARVLRAERVGSQI